MVSREQNISSSTDPLLFACPTDLGLCRHCGWAVALPDPSTKLRRHFSPFVALFDAGDVLGRYISIAFARPYPSEFLG
jgi:hypothetical protein